MRTPDKSISYNAQTGLFTRNGKLAGSKNSRGYVYIMVNKIKYPAHRLAWFYSTGAWPKYEIDHINGIKNDNRLSNLRDVPHNINMENLTHRSNKNKTKLGVTKRTYKSGRVMYHAVIKVNGKQRHLGLFNAEEMAHQAYIAQKKELHKGFNL